MKLLNQYISRQILVTTFVISLILTFIIWLTQSLRFLEMIVDGGAPIRMFVSFLLLAVPKFLQIALPLAFAIAVLHQLNKMAADNELVVMRSAGFSYSAIMRPVIYALFLVAVLLFVLGGWLTPMATKQVDRLRDIIRSDYSGALLRDGVFNVVGDGLTIYISERQGVQNLSGILIHQSSDHKQSGSTILAERGALVNRGDTPVIVVYDGQRQTKNRKTGHIETLRFDEYIVDISRMSDVTINAWVDEGERTLPELIDAVGDPATNDKFIQPFMAEIHTRLTRPILCAAFGLTMFAVLLSGRYNRRGHGRKTTGAVMLLILIQGLYLAASNMARDGMGGTIMLYTVTFVPILLSLLQVRRHDTLLRSPSWWNGLITQGKKEEKG